jgi:hypothetical protein
MYFFSTMFHITSTNLLLFSIAWANIGLLESSVIGMVFGYVGAVLGITYVTARRPRGLEASNGPQLKERVDP